MPLFSIVVPVYKPEPHLLAQTIESVRKQKFTDWELLLVDDCSDNPEVTKVLQKKSQLDSRIRFQTRSKNGGIVAASQDALNMAGGKWIVLLDHDDLLTKDALQAVSEAILTHPKAGYIYSNEDKTDESGIKHWDTFQKPKWSPERLRHQMYLGHLSVLRADLVKQVGGFRPGYDGSQDHDLALRVTELCEEVVHIPKVLYHWRAVKGSTADNPNEKDYASVSGLKAVNDHLQRVGRPHDKAVMSSLPHTYDTIRYLNPDIRVSVIIPTRGTAATIWGERRVMVTEAVRSLLQHTDHENLEIVVVYDSDTPAEVVADLDRIAGDKFVGVRYDKPFNFSEKCNDGFVHSTGQYVLFMNDDMQVNSDRYIEQMCSLLNEEDLGATGAYLVYEDESIQHVGLIFIRDDLRHPYRELSSQTNGYFSELRVNHEVSGVTGACMAMRRDVYEEVGGFSEDLPNNFNDVDLCYKIRSTGRRIVWLSDVRLYHFESKSRVNNVQSWEIGRIFGIWGMPKQDPYMPYVAMHGATVDNRSLPRRIASRIKRAIKVLIGTQRWNVPPSQFEQ